jgi:hypothetical protein
MAQMKKKQTSFKWKAEVSFEGTLEEFDKFKLSLSEHPIEIEMSEFSAHLDRSNAGYMRVNWGVVFPGERLDQMLEGMPRMKFERIRGFAGGIRTPHLHLGDEVVMVEKDRFKTMLGEVAKNIFELRVDTEDDFCDMIMPLVAKT